MKIGFLITLLVTGIHFSTFPQEKSEDKIFDYAETKHELSLDIDPIIQGNYPSSLLYRQHYVSKNGKNVALRLGALFYGNFASTENQRIPQNNIDRNDQNIYLYIGKEWQRQIQSRIIGYYGMDFGVGYSRSFAETLPNDPFPQGTLRKNSSMNLSGIGFLGMKYHFSKHFSVSAETSGNVNFYSSIYEFSRPTLDIEKETSNSFNFGIVPLRAIRFAFHF